jgi:uncharacterized protein (TIGR03067 family)
MPRAVPLLVVLSVGFAPAPVYRERPDSIKVDLEALQGEWQSVNCSLEGGEPTVGGGDDTAVYRGDRMSRLHKGVVNARWVIALDPSKEPRRMDLKGVEVPDQTVLCIYRIDGDTLTFAFRNQVDATERPKDFRPRPLVGIEVFRRKKP